MEVMTEKPLPTAEEFYLSHKSSDNNMPFQKKVAECITAYASLHTEQALREFAERVKAGNDLYPELAESRCGCSTSINTSRVDAIRDSLLTELRKGEIK